MSGCNLVVAPQLLPCRDTALNDSLLINLAQVPRFAVERFDGRGRVVGV